MAAEIETLFSYREVPWHGLGIIVEEAPNSEKALEISGLDWKVNKVPIYYNSSEENQEAMEMEEINEYFATIRESDNSVFGVVGNQYTIIQNQYAFEFIDDLFKLEEDITYETAGALMGGKKVWICVKAPDKIILDEKYSNYFIVSNSHDGKGSLNIALTPTRVVCQNTLTMALKGATRKWSLRHTSGIINKMEEAKKTLENNIKYMNELNKTAITLADKKLSLKMAKEFTEELFPIEKDYTERQIANVIDLREKLMTRYQKAPDLRHFQNNAWGVLLAVSDFVTHETPQRVTDTYQRTLFEKTMEGLPVLDRAYDILKTA